MDDLQVSVIILAWNGREYLGPCLSSVLAQTRPADQVIVVDNGSTDGSADLVAEQFPQVHLICNEHNLGFARGNNIGLRAATGDVLILLNQDTMVQPGWLAALVSALNDPAVGIAGCKILYPDGTFQHAGGYIYGARGESEHIGRHELDIEQYDQPREVDFVTGASIALTRSTWARIGPLDESFSPAYYEDVDWCYRVRAAGLRVVYWPAAVLIHHESTLVQVTRYAHKAVFHHGRLRLLFKHKPLSWLQQEFAPAEIGWAGRLGRTVEMMAVRDAYLRIMLSLPDLLDFRLQPGGSAFGQDPQKEWEALSTLVSGLRTVCAQDLSLESTADVTSSDWIPQDLWDQLQTRWQVQEQPFQSQVPVVGGGIAAFRQAWNSVSTRWYVLPILQQQVRFNRTVVDLATVLLDNAAGLRRDIAQNIRELDLLASAISCLQQRIEDLEKHEEKQ